VTARRSYRRNGIGSLAVNEARKDLFPIAVLLLLGSFAFVRLMALPAFEDEGSQLRWVWRLIEAGEWLQPLGDGKPLEERHRWLMAVGSVPMLCVSCSIREYRERRNVQQPSL
jgi:hypothetical protein